MRAYERTSGTSMLLKSLRRRAAALKAGSKCSRTPVYAALSSRLSPCIASAGDFFNSLLVHALPVRLRDEVLELRELAEERQVELADRAVALLRDDDVRDALAGRIGLVDLFSVDEHDQVGVLLDGAALAQIRHDGLLVRALL